MNLYFQNLISSSDFRNERACEDVHWNKLRKKNVMNLYKVEFYVDEMQNEQLKTRFPFLERGDEIWTPSQDLIWTGETVAEADLQYFILHPWFYFMSEYSSSVLLSKNNSLRLLSSLRKTMVKSMLDAGMKFYSKLKIGKTKYEVYCKNKWITLSGVEVGYKGKRCIVNPAIDFEESILTRYNKTLYCEFMLD